MPKASVLKRKYRVAEGPLRDMSRFGVYIQSECANFRTYWLEKRVGDGKIFIDHHSILPKRKLS